MSRKVVSELVFKSSGPNLRLDVRDVMHIIVLQHNGKVGHLVRSRNRVIRYDLQGRKSTTLI